MSHLFSSRSWSFGSLLALTVGAGFAACTPTPEAPVGLAADP